MEAPLSQPSQTLQPSQPQPQPQLSSQPIGSRRYKSRRHRPCDLCRARKVACAIETQPPCELCRSKGRPCTFVNGPGLRRRPARPAAVPEDGEQRQPGQDEEHQDVQHDAGLMIPVGDFAIPDFDFSFDAHDQLPAQGTDGSAGAVSDPFSSIQVLYDQLGPMELGLGDIANSGSAPVYPQHETMETQALQQHPAERQALRLEPQTPDTGSGLLKTITLEHQQRRSYRFVGPSGELDSYLISRRRRNAHLQSESPYTAITYQYTSPLEASTADFQPPSVFTVADTPRLENTEPKLELASVDQLRLKFRKLISNSFARELIRLFFHFISPSFPILSSRQIPTTDDDVDKMPLAFVAAICATSLPFIIYDDALCVEHSDAPSPTEVFRIAWTALQLESHDVRLSTIQASLLVLQRQAREDLFGEASVNWRLCGMVVASCQTLGLNRDPTCWKMLEPWERRLRKRLWWAVFVTETWTAFGQGMPSHIDLDQCDVPLLEMDDFRDDGVRSEDVRGSERHAHQFYYLVPLTLILRDINTAFFTVRAMRSTTGDLQLALNTAKPLRARLMQWHQSLPPSLRLTHGAGSTAESQPGSSSGIDNDLSSTGSLRLAYVVAHLSLFRALLRPLAMAALTAQSLSDQPSFWDSEGAVAVVQGALGSAKELVNFIESLTAADWDSFWHSWSKHNFAIGSTFLMHLLVLTQASQGATPTGFSPPQESPTHFAALAQAYSPSSAGSPSQDSSFFFSGVHSELQALAKRWRWALRLAERGAGGQKGLMSASLRRTEALFREWQIGKGGSR
ncbi:Fungal specific transcription factor domain containing protein [Pleurostoma richardsiae]|uniref:Fungal specific transcription factor domain containing protein n=1 Tax=Pleurostoma richardsiae TaxID=41990 RepID=A0AA38SD30_9PEZI|nr:Fungal specific transcription factor domain containing protein [Pleurostoma richardsiae]